MDLILFVVNFGDKNRFLTNRAIKKIATDQSFVYSLSIDQHLEYFGSNSLFLTYYEFKNTNKYIYLKKSAKHMVLI